MSVQRDGLESPAVIETLPTHTFQWFHEIVAMPVGEFNHRVGQAVLCPRLEILGNYFDAMRP
jgi:hypothetical protein